MTEKVACHPVPADDPVAPHVSSPATSRTGRIRAWATQDFPWALLLAVAAVSAAVFVVVRESVIDDAFTTLAYVRNFVEHFHWGLISAETANTDTSPLNVLLLSAGATVTRVAGGDAHPVAGLGLVFVGCIVVIAWGLWRIARVLGLPAAATALVGSGLVLFNPLLLSSTGLEVHLMAALIVLLLMAAIEARPLLFGVLAGLALLARLDLVLFVVVLALAARPIRRALLRVVPVTVLVALPWFLFSWFALGSAIPDTFVIKSLEHDLLPGVYTYAPGPFQYAERFGWPVTSVSFAPAAIGLGVLALWLVWRMVDRRAAAARFGLVAAVGVSGVIYYIAYSVMYMPSYHWYYGAPIVALSVVLTMGIGYGLSAAKPRGAKRALLLVPTVAVAASAVIGSAGFDADHGVPWGTPPIYTNWATPADYARVGKEVGELVGSNTVEAPPEIGALAYFCECAIVDRFSDPGRVLPLINYKIAESGAVGSTLLRWNYLWLDWNRQPRPVDYRLVYTKTPQPGPPTWKVWSPPMGEGFLQLLLAPDGRAGSCATAFQGAWACPPVQPGAAGW
ncbi:hypothetical protein [Amycolatopsis sp. SID8362]|uniref:hypothetical protein n=1 Tax=Amycolatopsis sp. SID8362 TaxID=2690346 RepID=UPI0013681C51|nr:hypothetical protein [Amycolatopsis sp. SID8362]NBH11793.1 hypothetical protein [Amycolatopsis sp. SID8362]NED48485.1 hypothetical protein [Amycolatopsis sp. SID8362]